MDRQDTQNEVDVIFCISDVPVLEMHREIFFFFEVWRVPFGCSEKLRFGMPV